MNVDAAIQRGQRAAAQVHIERARIRGDLEALFLLVGLAGLDIILAAERQSLAERYAARLDNEGFIR